MRGCFPALLMMLSMLLLFQGGVLCNDAFSRRRTLFLVRNPPMLCASSALARVPAVTYQVQRRRRMDILLDVTHGLRDKTWHREQAVSSLSCRGGYANTLHSLTQPDIGLSEGDAGIGRRRPFERHPEHRPPHHHQRLLLVPSFVRGHIMLSTNAIHPKSIKIAITASSYSPSTPLSLRASWFAAVTAWISAFMADEDGEYHDMRWEDRKTPF